MKKRIWVLILLCLMLCACERFIDKPEMTVTVTDDGSLYNGDEQRFFTVEENVPLTLDFAIQKESGFISVTVYNLQTPKDLSYRGTDLPSSEFSVTLRTAGTYRVHIQCRDFIGAYGIESTESAEK